jgi:hypothetical protein
MNTISVACAVSVLVCLPARGALAAPCESLARRAL